MKSQPKLVAPGEDFIGPGARDNLQSADHPFRRSAFNSPGFAAGETVDVGLTLRRRKMVKPSLKAKPRILDPPWRWMKDGDAVPVP